MNKHLRTQQHVPEFSADFRAQLLELFKWRRDVRQFKRDPLPQRTFERLLGIASLAPSVGLSEPWRFVIVESEARRAAIRVSFNTCNKTPSPATPASARRSTRSSSSKA